MNWKPLFFLLTLASAIACTTASNTNFGVQPNQLAHIPALSAILPCRLWPQNALVKNISATSVPPAEIATICAALDKFILDSATDQPYMRGLSPSVVLQLLQKKKAEASLGNLDNLWGGSQNLCPTCGNGPAYYSKAVASLPEWRQWLNTFSRNSADADAVLLPFVLEAKAGPIDDRGLFYAARSATILLLLVDSNNGDLIWAGKNSAEARTPLPGKPEDPTKVTPPAWEEVFKRLFQNEVWLEYPGRQN